MSHRTRSRPATLLVGGLIIGVLAVAVVDVVQGSPRALPPPIHVRADADPGGDGSPPRPFKSIQRGLMAARPGQTVHVGPGTYRESVASVRSGTRDNPIRVVGDDARIVGGKRVSHLLELRHNHLTVQGFELTNASTLIAMSHVSGVKVTHNDIHGARAECIRLRYLSSRNEIAFNTIRDCGREGFDLADDQKNGEGVYVGTAPEQLDRNPRPVPDRSDRNWVHDNRIVAPAECVDIKEAARGNLVSGNRCSGSKDPKGAGFSSRGNGTIFRGNDSGGHRGSGIRLGGDTSSEGIDNIVEGNNLHDNGRTGLRVVREPQRRICGNVVVRNGEGPVNRSSYDPAGRCPRGSVRAHSLR